MAGLCHRPSLPSSKLWVDGTVSTTQHNASPTNTKHDDRQRLSVSSRPRTISSVKLSLRSMMVSTYGAQLWSYILQLKSNPLPTGTCKLGAKAGSVSKKIVVQVMPSDRANLHPLLKRPPLSQPQPTSALSGRSDVPHEQRKLHDFELQKTHQTTRQ